MSACCLSCPRITALDAQNTAIVTCFQEFFRILLELNRLEQSDAPDAVNFVSRGIRNNGVSASIRPIDGVEPAKAGTLSVALGGQGGAGETFLQPFPYYCGRDV